jgi:light-regulated signal transduction histidine kinase (bacteriophytochrome)
MSGLINDLLAFARVTTKGQPFVPVDLNGVLGEVLEDLEVGVAEAGAVVHADDLPTIEADPTQVRQLFQNLIANAIKFRREGVPPQIAVESRMLTPETGPSRGSNGAMCRITVTDNGIGFEPRFAERIFGVFQRLHTRDQYEGTGIGLAVCRKIAERHGGTITGQGSPGAGASFIVTLPARHPPGDRSQ